MSVELLMGGGGSELLVDLKACKGFGAMKLEMERSLCNVDHYLLESPVNIDIGSKRLTERQLRELEDIMLSHGVHLKNVVSNRSPVLSGNTIPINQSVAEIAESGDTVLLCRNLRSGQKVLAQGHMVILGDIHPGAEVVAGGNILVMGALKGLAHAGVYGNESAVVAAILLRPTQLRIADHITRSPDGEDVTVNNPEVARIRAGKVVIERLKF
ncbi:MAG: septum site-determining protein MinC [Bacillota bacterium]|nr:septum site-determining protein MinC [Bacillota bacterium]